MAGPGNPFDQFDAATPPPPPSRQVYQEVKTPNPQTAEEAAHTVAETNKTNKEAANIVTPHVLTAEEVAANPTLNPTKTWAISSDGNVKPIGDVPQPFKVGDSDAISHAWGIVDDINSARQLAQKPLATGTLSATVANIPVIGGVIGQNRANLQTKLGGIAGDLRQLGIQNLYQSTGQKGVGSVARNQAEQQALQSSLAPLGFVDTGSGHVTPTGAQPDAATLGQGLDQAQSLYIRHLARLYGMNPDDPSTVQLIGHAASDPKLRAQLLSSIGTGAPGATASASGSTPSGDNGASLPPPMSGLSVSSGDTKVAVDPKLQAIAPQLTQYLNADPSKVSNAMILGFMQKSGVDPVSTNIMPLLQMRATGKYKGFTVDPRTNVPLSGAEKLGATISGSAPGAAVAGAVDTGTMGAIPDIVGGIHAITGLGPSRADAVQARDAMAANSPTASLIGDAVGAVASPFARGGGLLRTAGLGGLYGALASDDPDIQSRLINAGIGATIGAAAHGGTSLAVKGAQGGYRAAGNTILSALTGDPEALATGNALAKAANQMPDQDVDAAAAKLAALKQNGANPPAAAALSRSGQDYLARLTAGSPSARAAADEAAGAYRKAMPEALASDFDAAIHDAAPANNGHTADFLNRPTRDIASDVQSLAGREYEMGIAPIAKEPLVVTPDLADTLAHDRIGPAIKDALANHQLDDDTRALLRGLPAKLKALSGVDAQTVTVGGKSMTADEVRAAFPNDADAILASAGVGNAPEIPLTVDAGRNIATALDRTAAKMQDGSEAAVNLHQVSGEIRNAIGQQYPEYQGVNERYASRMRAIDAMDAARRNFMGESPEQIDALAKASKNFTDVPGEPPYSGPHTDPSGPVQPTNRQFALAGAREAANVKAGAGTGSGGTTVARTLAEGPNQQARTAMVAGDDAAAKIASGAGAKADVADTYDRVTSGASGDQAQRWYQLAKQAVTTKLTGGTAHYAAAHALAGMPGMSGDDATRVVRVFLDANSADQALGALSKAYGARQARFIMARMAGVAAAANSTKGAPQPANGQ